MLVFPPEDPSLLPRGAAAFEVASFASVCPIAPHQESLLFACRAVGQRLSRRAAIDVGIMIIGEVGLHKMPL